MTNELNLGGSSTRPTGTITSTNLVCTNTSTKRKRTIDRRRLINAAVLALVLAGIIVALLLLAGCSGLQAKPLMAAKIDNNAVCAKIAQATSQPVGEAKTSLHVNALALEGYYRASTINLFAYWFSDKEIFCTSRYYKLLQKMAISSAAWDLNATKNKYSDATIQALLKEEYLWFGLVKNARDGVGE